MSSLEFNLKSGSSSSLVEKILEHGQRLRNSMVQAVLINDPFNKEVLQNNSQHINTRHKSSNVHRCNVKTRSEYDQVQKYLHGDDMELTEEMLALETLRSMSPNSLWRSTSEIKCHRKNCCDICKEYENRVFSGSISPNIDKLMCNNIPLKSHRPKHNFNYCDTKHVISNQKMHENQIPIPDHKQKSSNKTCNILKYVDSLNIHVYSLKFNNAGNTKISACASLNKPYFASNNTYFVEYALPDILIKKQPPSRAKVNSGINPDKTTRFCSKKVQKDSVYFKQQFIHLIQHIDMIDLNSITLEFRVSYRSVRQRTAILIGTAIVNFGTLVTNQFLSTEQELKVLSESAPVVLGYLKVALQFGCDKIYFGKEFIDAINCSKENANLSDNDSIHKNELKTTYFNVIKSNYDKHLQHTNENDQKVVTNNVPQNTINKAVRTDTDNTHLLYTLIYVSEVRLLSKPVDSYIICRGFSRDDTFISKTIYNNSNPIFNLYQLIPNFCTEDFVYRLRDNYIIIEVWEKKDVDALIGISKLSLHQLYIAYRNPAIVQHLSKNQYPTITVDWWESISSPNSNIDHGQLKALVALGTQSQIETLERNRNLKLKGEIIEPIPKRNHVDEYDKIPELLTIPDKSKNSLQNKETLNLNCKNCTKDQVARKVILMSDKCVQEPDLDIVPSITQIDGIARIEKIHETNRKVDVSTQSEVFAMNSETKDSKSPVAEPPLSQTEFLNSFFEHLLSARDLNQCAKNVEKNTTPDTGLVTDKSESPTPEVTKDIDSTAKIPLLEEMTVENMTNTSKSNNFNSVSSIRNTSDLLDNLQKALGVDNRNEENQMPTNKSLKVVDNKESFKAHIVIESALHLPSRKKCKSKRNKMKNPKSNEEILPSTYVTFKGYPNSEDYFMTSVVPKSTSPNWDFRCDSYLSSDLLQNNQKRLILKVWRKSNGPSLQPNHDTDIVLGFAAIDLTVLLSGMPNVQGWFNIVDFTSKCNGQIKISVTPLETLTRFHESRPIYSPEKLEPVSFSEVSASETEPNTVPSELFSRALKRKFTELDEITQRLRQRLSAVTNDDSDVSNDFDDEFERDLNTECMETEKLTFDHDIDKLIHENTYNLSSKLINSEDQIVLDVSKETDFPTKSNSVVSEVSDDISSTPLTNVEQTKKSGLDSHLLEEKLKIDSLLEKLTLLSGDAENQYRNAHSFTQRYVSGCSTNDNPELRSEHQKDIDHKSPDSLDTDLIFNPLLFQHMFTSSLDSTPRLSAQDSTSSVQCTTLKSLVHDSLSSSSISNDTPSTSSVHLPRQAPDGAGNSTGHSQNNIDI